MKITTVGLPKAITPPTYDRGFEEHASIESIRAHLDDAKVRLKSAEIKVRWLERLEAQRVAQIEAGLWPTRDHQPTKAEKGGS